MSLKKVSIREIGLRRNHLYEILATTVSKDETLKEITPNTSCMGIRVIQDDILTIGPYPTTQTYKNLKDNGLLTINLADNIKFYAIAALKAEIIDSSRGIQGFSLRDYGFRDVMIQNEKTKERYLYSFPFLKEAWASIFCKAIDKKEYTKQDGLGKTRLTQFKMRVLECIKINDSYKLFNRAENLALELIILATRLKVAREMSNESLFQTLQTKYQDIKQDILRFSKNEHALKSIELTDRYIQQL